MSLQPLAKDTILHSSGVSALLDSRLSCKKWQEMWEREDEERSAGQERDSNSAILGARSAAYTVTLYYLL